MERNPLIYPCLRHVLLDIIEKNFVRPEGKYWEMSQVSEHYSISPTIDEPEAGEDILISFDHKQ